MKDIYMIWEANWGNTGIFFDNKKDAQEYCKLKNNQYDIDTGAHYMYSIKSMTFYKSIEDYKIKRGKDYKNELKSAIESLKNSIAKIENNRYDFDVRLDDDYYLHCTLEKFEDILNDFKEEKFYVNTPGYETFLGYKPGEYRYLTKKDLPIVEKGYEKSKEQLKDMKTTLKKYQKEFVELCGGEKQTIEEAEEKELTK